MNLKFSLKTSIQEDHKQQIYCVKFCNILPAYDNIFASVGSNRVSIYEASDEIELIQSFFDNDEAEIFYTCTWVDFGNQEPIIVAAGLRGILKAINCATLEVVSFLPGHGDIINELRTHPVDSNLVISASRDESIRLWNVRNAVCIAMFYGDNGHKDDVLSIDIHQLGHIMVSSGMDTCIKIWSLVTPIMSSQIAKSYTEPYRLGCNLPFQTTHIPSPIFSTSFVHTEYVDSVCFYGNFILSKSAANRRVVMWRPSPQQHKVLLYSYTLIYYC